VRAALKIKRTKTLTAAARSRAAAQQEQQGVRLTHKAKGKKPTFFADPQVDKTLAITMALAGEVSVLRERLDTIERLLEAKGLLSRQETESYRPGEHAAEEREHWRAEYLDRILRVVREEREAIAAEETPASYDNIVRDVSS
jgi:hypothetical protein